MASCIHDGWALSCERRHDFYALETGVRVENRKMRGGASRVDVICILIGDGDSAFRHLYDGILKMAPRRTKSSIRKVYLNHFTNVLCVRSIIFTQPVVCDEEGKKGTES